MLPLEFFTDLSAVQRIVGLALLFWLVVEATYDIRDQSIPLVFSVAPILAGLGYLVWLGQWPVALIMFLLLAFTNLPSPFDLVLVIPGVLAGGYFYPPEYWPLLAGFVLVFALFRFGAMGGADALAVVYMLLWIPAWGMLVALLVGTLLFSLGALFWHYGREGLLRMYVTLRTGAQGKKAAGLAGFALGAGLYLSAFFLLAA